MERLITKKIILSSSFFQPGRQCLQNKTQEAASHVDSMLPLPACQILDQGRVFPHLPGLWTLEVPKQLHS
jgi:hypothetical protein